MKRQWYFWQPPKKELVQQIENIVCAHSLVQGIHDLIVHDYGPGRLMISLHAEVPAKGDILLIHDEIDNIEQELQKSLNCAATIHMDPVITDNQEILAMKNKVLALVQNMDPSFTIHDFRMVEGPTHTNLVFDVVMPFQCRYTEVEVINQLKQEIHAFPEKKYFAVIQVDRQY